jgi:DNA repair protein RecO (recombination protein O)
VSIEKTPCIVLSVMPYRETSAIATLLSRAHGRVSGIAKGVRRTALMPIVLERGLLVETMLYVKPHRDLHTMGETSVLRDFPGVRSDLNKLTLRDVAFELVLRSVTASDTHGELFDFTLAFLERLEAATGTYPVPVLWSFLYGWASHCGFSLNLKNCVRCTCERAGGEGGTISHEQGGLVCRACGNERSPSFLPAEVAGFLLATDRGENDPPFQAPFAPAEQLRITRLLADYCRYHLDIRGDFKSIAFMESMMGVQG